MGRRDDIAAAVARAFDQAGDLVLAATLARVTPGAYDPNDGRPADPLEISGPCRALFEHKPKWVFSGLVARPGQAALWLEGAPFAPMAGDRLDIDGAGFTLLTAADMAGAGALWLVTCE